jgi:hypothetical protein
MSTNTNRWLLGLAETEGALSFSAVLTPISSAVSHVAVKELFDQGCGLVFELSAPPPSDDVIGTAVVKGGPRGLLELLGPTCVVMHRNEISSAPPTTPEA